MWRFLRNSWILCVMYRRRYIVFFTEDEILRTNSKSCVLTWQFFCWADFSIRTGRNVQCASFMPKKTRVTIATQQSPWCIGSEHHLLQHYSHQWIWAGNLHFYCTGWRNSSKIFFYALSDPLQLITSACTTIWPNCKWCILSVTWYMQDITDPKVYVLRGFSIRQWRKVHLLTTMVKRCPSVKGASM